MKRLIASLAAVAVIGMAGQALALQKKVNIFNGAQYDIYTLYLSPTNANAWEEKDVYKRQAPRPCAPASRPRTAPRPSPPSRA